MKTQDEFARGLDPLLHDDGDQPQQDRFVLEQAPKPAGFHVGDELIVKRGVGAHWAFAVGGALAQLGEAFIERRSAKSGEFPEQQVAQGRARGVRRDCRLREPRCPTRAALPPVRPGARTGARTRKARPDRARREICAPGCATPCRSRLRRRSRQAGPRRLRGGPRKTSSGPH